MKRIVGSNEIYLRLRKDITEKDLLSRGSKNILYPKGTIVKLLSYAHNQASVSIQTLEKDVMGAYRRDAVWTVNKSFFFGGDE